MLRALGGPDRSHRTTGTAGRTDMRTRRLAGLGLGLVGTVALAVAGCTADGTTPGAGTSSPSSTLAPGAPASSGAADPAAAAALGRAAAALGNQSFKATL